MMYHINKTEKEGKLGSIYRCESNMRQCKWKWKLEIHVQITTDISE